MSEMVERVAAAIDPGAFEVKAEEVRSAVLALRRDQARRMAERAIAAMREPTPEMIDHGLFDSDNFNLLGVGQDELAAVYTRMIDAAAGKKDG